MFEPLQPAEWQALLLTLRVSGMALLFVVPLAVLVAYVLARTRFPGHGLLNALIHLPLVLPPVVTGFVLLLFFGPRGPGGQFMQDVFGISLAFNWKGAAVAAGVMAFPLVVRPIRQAFESADRKLEEAAGSLGTGRVLTFLLITLPLALPGIIGGAILGFAKAMGEFGATITFVSNIPGETRTLSLALYTATQSPDGDVMGLRLTVIAVILAILAIVLSEGLMRWLKARMEGADA